MTLKLHCLEECLKWVAFSFYTIWTNTILTESTFFQTNTTKDHWYGVDSFLGLKLQSTLSCHIHRIIVIFMGAPLHEISKKIASDRYIPAVWSKLKDKRKKDYEIHPPISTYICKSLPTFLLSRLNLLYLLKKKDWKKKSRKGEFLKVIIDSFSIQHLTWLHLITVNYEHYQIIIKLKLDCLNIFTNKRRRDGDEMNQSIGRKEGWDFKTNEKWLQLQMPVLLIVYWLSRFKKRDEIRLKSVGSCFCSWAIKSKKSCNNFDHH